VISVVIPAHNEEAVIGRCLRALLTGADPDELEIVVACNGCTDATADIARSFGPPVRVVETPVASKIAALNLGDAAATGFPRFFVDADVEFDGAGLRAVAEVLREGRLLAAAPGLRIDTSGASWLVRAYYRVLERLPSVSDDLVGRGVYALSAEGRARFGEFPDVIADDHFVRRSFAPSERGVVAGVASTVRVPVTLRGLLQRKVRVFAGNAEIAEHGSAHREGLSGLLAVLRADPTRMPDVAVYVAVNAVAKGLAWRARRRGSPLSWGRDDSRQPSLR